MFVSLQAENIFAPNLKIQKSRKEILLSRQLRARFICTINQNELVQNT